ncbi:MAG: hypothetical protein R6V58_09960, partial [Planctomycetota bacterium]
MKIAVLSYLATYGNAPLVCNGLAQLGHEVRLILRYRNVAGESDYGFAAEFRHWEMEDSGDAREARAWAAAADFVVVHAIPSLDWLVPRVYPDGAPPGVVICTSSHLFLGLPADRKKRARLGLDPVAYNNKLLRDSGWPVLVQPHKWAYIDRRLPSVRTYYPPIELPFRGTRPSQLLICGHSPGKESRRRWKGTSVIQEAFDQLEEQFPDRVMALVASEQPHWRILRARGHWHICVDQVCPPHEVEGDYPAYCGGLDKSGLEAMAAGCAVVTSGGPHRQPDGQGIAEPPVVTADASSLYPFTGYRGREIDGLNTSHQFFFMPPIPNQVRN